jgi:hypothetical protein
LAKNRAGRKVALITKGGEAFGGVIKVDAASTDYKLSLSALRKVKVVNLPRPYPTFPPYFFEDKRSETMDIMDAEVLQISIGPGIPDDQVNDSHGVAIESVRLENNLWDVGRLSSSVKIRVYKFIDKLSGRIIAFYELFEIAQSLVAGLQPCSIHRK